MELEFNLIYRQVWIGTPGVNWDKQLSNVCITSLSVSPLLVISLDSKRRVQAQGGLGTPSQKRAQKDENKVEIRKQNKGNRETGHQEALHGQRYPCPALYCFSVIVGL